MGLKRWNEEIENKKIKKVRLWYRKRKPARADRH